MLMQKIKEFKFLKSPFITAAIICFAVAIAIPLFVSNSEKKEIKGVSQKINPTSTPTPTALPSPTYFYKQTSTNPTTIPRPKADQPLAETQTTSSSNNQQNPTSTPTSAPAQAAKTFQVSLKINDSSVGNVDVQEGGNQCDVLTRAKDQGKISQLLMKYDNNLGTYGIYQINGQGQENSVWWTYKVNGASPSQGCSLVKANSGDSVEWKYAGN